MSLERLWAGWRSAYVEGVATQPPVDPDDCLMCGLARAPVEDRQVIVRRELAYAVLNAFPYSSGHLMVVPVRHAGHLDELTDAEADELMHLLREADAAIKAAYSPDGVNVGMNLGRAAGAGVPGHLHAHLVPRWYGDTNFMTSVAEVRVLPESLPTTWEKLRAAWPEDLGG
jgi:diadenosine tetraphosphate (Ap4A) HIT family hydrolase